MMLGPVLNHHHPGYALGGARSNGSWRVRSTNDDGDDHFGSCTSAGYGGSTAVILSVGGVMSMLGPVLWRCYSSIFDVEMGAAASLRWSLIFANPTSFSDLLS